MEEGFLILNKMDLILNQFSLILLLKIFLKRKKKISIGEIDMIYFIYL